MQRSTKSLRAALLLAFLCFLNVLNFVDRNLLGALGQPISRDLSLSDKQLGLLIGFAFVLFYTLAGLMLGTVADRWHRPRLIALGLFLWSGATAASGLAGGFSEMLTARLFIGLGEATLVPSALSMLSDVFETRHRAMAVGVFYTGVTIGSGAALLIAGEAVGTHGYDWRYCYYGLGLLGVALSVVVWFVRDPPRGAAPDTPAAAETSAAARSTRRILAELAAALRASPALVATLIGGGFLAFALAAFNFYPKWLMRERGFTIQDVGRIGAPIFVLAGLTGSTLGGVLSDACHRRWQGGRLYFIAVAQILIIPFVIAHLLLPPRTVLFYVCWCLAAVSTSLLYGPVFASVQDLVPVKIRSTTLGFLLFCLNILGTSPGAFLAGAVADWTGTLTAGLLFCAFFGWLCVPFFFYAARHYARDIARVRAAENG